MLAAEKTKSMMKPLARPGCLVQGEQYWLIQRGTCRQSVVEEPVTFIGYTPCPATVIVLDRQQRRLYCEKGNLMMEGFLELYVTTQS